MRNMDNKTEFSEENKDKQYGNPLYTVPTSPFTIVTLDSEESPIFDKNALNTLEYDRLKICRTTTVIDSKLPQMNKMGVIVSYTCALLYPRIPEISQNDLLTSSNRILLKMTFGGIEFDAVSPRDIGYGLIYNNGYFVSIGCSGSNSLLLTSLQYRDVRSFDVGRLTSARIYKASEIQAALSIGESIVDDIPEISPDLFLNGLTYFKNGEFAPALVFLWSTCESLIRRLWKDHNTTDENIPNRMSFLKSNAWQAAHIVELLFRVNLIDQNLYVHINRARLARNTLSHKARYPTLVECKSALYSTFMLISSVRSSGKIYNEFDKLSAKLASVHDPHTGPLAPEAWRELPLVPGDSRWEGDYPHYPEIELKPLL